MTATGIKIARLEKIGVYDTLRRLCMNIYLVVWNTNDDEWIRWFATRKEAEAVFDEAPDFINVVLLGVEKVNIPIHRRDDVVAWLNSQLTMPDN